MSFMPLHKVSRRAPGLMPNPYPRSEKLAFETELLRAKSE